ncbi:MAG: cysteine hydrolase [Acidobacteriota bacterium]
MMRILILSLGVVLCSATALRSDGISDPQDRWTKPALLIVDMQNDFVRKGAPMEVPTARSTIPQHRQLIAFCRQAGIPVIYTRFLSGPHRTLIWEFSPQLAPPTLACRRGHQRFYADVDRKLECTDIIDEIAPWPGDPIIDKYGYGAFHNTSLDGLLQSLGVQSLMITGTVTQICVEETARQAFHFGYRTTVVSDAVSSYLPDLHEAALKNHALKFGWVSTAAEVLQNLRARFGGPGGASSLR